jgi:thermostable 8-oxoguanine DNA glycosylase
MFLDQLMAEKLGKIQRQGPGWQDDRDYVPDPKAREELVHRLWIELVGGLAMASHTIRLMGYPNAAQCGESLLKMVREGDVREHEVREAINTFHHQFHPQQGRYLVK